MINMNILIFYRSKDITNSIISSTRVSATIKNLTNLGINIEYLNLDKRNYQKYFSSLETLPDKIFVWSDEKIVTDYIKTNYPAIEIIYYNRETAISFHEGYWGNYKGYNLADMIKEVIGKSFKNIDVYEVKAGTFEVEKKTISEFTFKSSPKSNVFETEDKANQFIVQTIKQSIECSKSRIKEAENTISWCNEEIKGYNKLLKKFAIT
jgi:hypothetical protein